MLLVSFIRTFYLILEVKFPSTEVSSHECCLIREREMERCREFVRKRVEERETDGTMRTTLSLCLPSFNFTVLFCSVALS